MLYHDIIMSPIIIQQSAKRGVDVRFREQADVFVFINFQMVTKISKVLHCQPFSTDGTDCEQNDSLSTNRLHPVLNKSVHLKARVYFSHMEIGGIAHHYPNPTIPKMRRVLRGASRAS